MREMEAKPLQHDFLTNDFLPDFESYLGWHSHEGHHSVLGEGTYGRIGALRVDNLLVARRIADAGILWSWATYCNSLGRGEQDGIKGEDGIVQE